MFGVHFDLNTTLRTSSSEISQLLVRSAFKGSEKIAHLMRKTATCIADRLFPTCVICFKRIYTKSKTTPCKHIFHEICLNKWAKINPTCPNDRTPLYPNSIPSSNLQNNQPSQQFLNLIATARLLENLQRAHITLIEDEFKNRDRSIPDWTGCDYFEYRAMDTILEKYGYLSTQQKLSLFAKLSPEVQDRLPYFQTFCLSSPNAILEDRAAELRATLTTIADLYQTFAATQIALAREHRIAIQALARINTYSG